MTASSRRTVRFVDPASDGWSPAPADGPAAAEAQRILTLEQWRAARERWPDGVPVGVVVPNDADVKELLADLPRLALVALEFPKWTDGRAYSQARLLRVRHRYAGELRATGDVIADMLPMLVRTGFDAVLLRADQSRAVAERALGFFAGRHYQGDATDPAPRFARGGARLGTAA